MSWKESVSLNAIESSLETLERLGQMLQIREQAREQVRLTLEAICDCLEADAVFLHPGTSLDAYQQVGSPELSPWWAEQFVAQVATRDRDVVHLLDPGGKPLRPWPTSAVVLRLSQSRQSWLVALSFHPRRLFEPVDLKLALLARRLLLNQRKQGQFTERLRDSMIDMVRGMAILLDGREACWKGHSERVGLLAMELGKRLDLSGSMLVDLYLAGLLHDIGRLAVPERLLHFAGPLDVEQQSRMQEHTLFGDRIVAAIRPLRHLWPWVRHHHERWDGQGYPDGLAGEAIPLEARILAVADACDAMASPRPFRLPMSLDEIETVLLNGAGTQWDPDIIQAFLMDKASLYEVCRERNPSLPPEIMVGRDSDQGLL